MPYLLDKVWIIPAIMAGSFLVILLVGKRFSERVTSLFGIFAVGICFVLSCTVAVQWIQRVNHPPEGAAMAQAEADCHALTAEHEANESGGSSSETGTNGEHGTEGGTEGEAPAAGESSEHGLGPIGVVEGESAAGMQEHETPASEEPAATTSEGGTEGEGHGAGEATTTSEEGGHGEAAEEHHEVVPVCATVTWFEIGNKKFEAGTLLDGLSALMLFTVTLISLLVHIYSTEYLHEDRRFTHYYAFLSLFTASMLFYVLGSNTLQMLVGWELVGVCSFALIGHWWEEKANTDAALKAFLTNRVGDVGLLLGVIVLFFAAGKTFNIQQINGAALAPAGIGAAIFVIGGLLLFGGVTSKSGQFPLHTWLPDAMAGPTPVSALIHAATMVVAGVYLIARMYPVFFAGLHIGWGPLAGADPHNYLNWVAIAGGLTTLVGGSLAFVQQDLKKVLAYSTISQLGYMVLGLGVGAWTGAIFHLFTHAMFKACLFLGAGSVSHACHHTFDMREMGGLKKYMPVTFVTFMIGSGALAGLPLFAGFWSKDEILAGATQNGYYVVLAMGVITAFMTAAYTTRAVYKTFYGEYRGHAHPHESPKVITVPLIILSGMAILLVLGNIPLFVENSLFDTIGLRFEHFVQPTFLFPPSEGAYPTLPEVHFNIPLAIISTIIAISGIGIAWAYMKKPFNVGATEKIAPLRGGYKLLVNKYYLDVLYTDIIAGSMKGSIARAMYWINMNVIDKVVNLVGAGAAVSGRLLYKYVDQGVVDTIVNGSGMATEGGGKFLRRSQTGKVQQYASFLFGGAVAFALIFMIALHLSTTR